MTTFAYCWATGEIGFGPSVPSGALPIARGRADRLRRLIEPAARHAYDRVTLLVPGVPEAPGMESGVDALMDWCDWLAQRQPHGVRILGCRCGGRATA